MKISHLCVLAGRNVVFSFVRGGLQDLSVSRLKTSVSWGVPSLVIETYDVCLVRALSNYITAIGFGNEERQKAVGFENSGRLCTVGKDILRFHGVGHRFYSQPELNCQKRLSLTECGWIQMGGKCRRLLAIQ